MTGISARALAVRRQRPGRPLPSIRRGAPTPCGTQRRLQALMTQGWSVPAIAQATGMRSPQLARALEYSGSITPTLAAAVIKAYDQLWDQPPPVVNEQAQERAAASAELARHHGWAPPLAWDDDQIDREDGRPAEGWQPSLRTTRRSKELAEDAQFVRSAGGYREATVRVLAIRLGVNQKQLEKALSRQRAAAAGGRQLELG